MNDGVSWTAEENVFPIFSKFWAVRALLALGSGESALEKVPSDVLVSLNTCPLVVGAPDLREGDVEALFPFQLGRSDDD